MLVQGRAVYFYVANQKDARLLRDKANHMGLQRVWQHAKFEALPEGFNWETFTPHNRAHLSCAFIVDHSLIESELLEIDKQIMRLQQLARQLYHLTT